jgi:Asp-tRNA(Asn)/Glu-tRNA(Gln) amidotransferase B subunit
MVDYNTKMMTLAKCLQNGAVSPILAAAEMQDFLKSDFNDAYDYFAHKGMIQTIMTTYEQIACELLKLSHEESGWRTLPIKSIVGMIMRRMNGKANPNTIKDILVCAGWDNV